MALPFVGTLRTMPELTNKLLFTLGLLAIYRIGFYVPLPIIDQAKLQSFQESVSSEGGLGKLMSTVAMFGGTDIGMATIFGLGIMPYISASIVFQLLGSVVPQLEALMKEGESGRKKINEYTRYATVLFCVIQSSAWLRFLMERDIIPAAYQSFGFIASCVIVMTAGTIFLMWLGEQIDEYGIGNGISMLIMAGILARAPAAIQTLATNATFKLSEDPGEIGPVKLLLLLAMFIGVIVGVVIMTESQRRIPTQSARHVRGRRMTVGARQYLPLKVNQAGVMPIIFASSLMSLPWILFNTLRGVTASWIDPDATTLGARFASGLAQFFEAASDAFGQPSGFVYLFLNITLIYFFCYLWTAITFNPKDMAENLKDYGSFIPGYRPGKRTADYLEKVMLRITYVGAAFLSLVAIIPTLVQDSLDVSPIVASFLGGTGLLIVVSVCLDLVHRIDSHLVMRNYPTLLNKR
ncbi:protein translocase subunit secY/sec61 alpha [Isosphaera pallida ATCC 43644]|uniref:Protein translocase subunit SecY n=2 Tax=Isosphaera pallida TaxID=128 RepID=E8R478_ISOPI|nr:preprotein translocase subunit SecY [Isosphaera pallida]ADV62679.1 protein translocase subunit secY/sec61 alpha [Isosphaera pallida ATCC 43644]